MKYLTCTRVTKLIIPYGIFASDILQEVGYNWQEVF